MAYPGMLYLYPCDTQEETKRLWSHAAVWKHEMGRQIERKAAHAASKRRGQNRLFNLPPEIIELILQWLVDDQLARVRPPTGPTKRDYTKNGCRKSRPKPGRSYSTEPVHQLRELQYNRTWSMTTPLRLSMGLLRLSQTCRYFRERFKDHVYLQLCVRANTHPKSYFLSPEDYDQQIGDERPPLRASPKSEKPPADPALVQQLKRHDLGFLSGIRTDLLTRLWLGMCVNAELVNDFAAAMKGLDQGRRLKIFFLILSPTRLYFRIHKIALTLLSGRLQRHQLKWHRENCLEALASHEQFRRAWRALRCKCAVYIGPDKDRQCELADRLRRVERGRLKGLYELEERRGMIRRFKYKDQHREATPPEKDLMPHSSISFLDFPLEVRFMVYSQLTDGELFDAPSYSGAFIDFMWKQNTRSFFPACYAQEFPPIFPLLFVCRAVRDEILQTTYRNLNFYFHVRSSKSYASNLPEVECPFLHIRNLFIHLHPLKRFGRNFKSFMKKLSWGAHLAKLSVEIGDSCFDRSVVYGGVIKIGQQSEIRDMVAYWGRIRFGGKIRLYAQNADIDALKAAEEERWSVVQGKMVTHPQHLDASFDAHDTDS
ncbi:hypothetical protein B9Z65_1449 [Elsinoe australis]|uniref:Uncharacterized protein n=1 Tax=Elsinoe australis TaxID=40998 RepID=A0A2P7YFX6_9PEZI|nr:hypothetical protein B9Z65_1449 [Elsinoe australis]